MILYFADRKFNILGMASTGQLPESLLFYDDLETQEIEKGSTILTGYLSIENNLSEINRLAKIGNYILTKDETGDARLFTIIRKEKNRKNQEVFIYSEDAGLDLLNEVVDGWSAPATAQPITYYLQKALYDSGFEIGINELTGVTKRLEWSAESTTTKRLLEIAEEFDHAEIGFGFTVSGMKVTQKKLNIYKKRGVKTQIELRLDRDIENIVTEESIENLATTFRVKGGKSQNSDQPITLKGYNYDDGRFYTNGIYLHDRKSLATWSRYLSESGGDVGHIVVNYTYDTSSQAELCKRAVAELKKRAEVEVNYQVDIAILPDEVRIGDTINLVDEDDALYLEARILKLERSRSKGSAIATLGEYLIKDSGINQRLQDLADKIATIQSGDTYYPWVRYADDDKGTGISAMPLGKKYMAIKYAKNEPIPSDKPEDYITLWTKIVGEDGKNGSTGLTGPPGADGQPTYMWVKYADDVNGNGMSDDATNKKYIGLAHNKLQKEPSTIKSDYHWSAMYDNKALEAVNARLSDVNSTSLSPTAPTEPKTGDNWWQSFKNNEGQDEVTGMFRWNGKEWQPAQIQQDNLVIKNLSSVSLDSVKISGASIVNEFKDVPNAGAKLTGTTSLNQASIRMDYKVENGQTGLFVIEPQAILSYINNKDGSLLKSYSLSGSGLYFKDSYYGVGTLTVDSLVKTAWINLNLNNGWATAENNTPMYRKKKSLDGTFQIEFKGQVKPSSGQISASISHTFATIPTGCLPAKNIFVQSASAAPYYGARLGALNNGQLRINSPVATDYVVLDQLSYNIDF